MADPYHDYEEHESLVDRSVSFFKELSGRLREGASRKWRSTSLNLDIGLLRRRRRNWILALGQATYRMMRRGGVEAEDLREYVEEIRSLEEQIAAREEKLGDLEHDDLLELAEQDLLAEPLPRRRRTTRRAARRRATPEEAGAAATEEGAGAGREEPGEDMMDEPHGVG